MPKKATARNSDRLPLAQPRSIEALCGARLTYNYHRIGGVAYDMPEGWRDKVLKFEGAWHGMHDYGLWGTAPATPSDYPSAKRDSAGIPDAIAETVLVAPFNDVDRTARIVEEHASEIAAVIVEPLQRVLRPDPGFLQFLRDITRRHGIVLAFDEIVTGFRLAWGGAQEVYGVVPDLATYGKAMSGGLPLAALVGSAEVMSVLDARRTERSKLAWATHTLSTNPVSAAGANAAPDVLSRPGERRDPPREEKPLGGAQLPEVRDRPHERRQLGWKGMLKRRGWVFVAFVVLVYLVRDLVLYVLVPLAVVAGLRH